MRKQDEDAQHGGHPGGQHRTEDAHPHGENKDVVQHDVGQAACCSGQHGQPGVPVVADEAEQHVVDEGGGGEEEQHLEIGPGHLKHSLVGPQEDGDPMGAEQAQQEEGDGEEDGQKKHAGEHPGSAAGVPPALMNGVFGGPAHPQHQAGAVDEVVDGDSQIQGGQPGSAQALGHEESVGQDVAGHRDHAAGAEGGVADKLPQRSGL